MLKDPILDIIYPDDWVKACKSPEALEDVRKGLAVLTSSGLVLKRGYSTGTTAAAACKAAVISMKKDAAFVDVSLPCGLVISLKVTSGKGRASALKFSGDYIGDATSGAEFRAVARLSSGISLEAGSGIGRFSRDLPGHRKGTPAISDAAMSYILHAIDEGVKETGIEGASVKLSVTKGEAIAGKTLNHRLGIIGGISVLGTTGLVEPWDDHASESVMERLERLDGAVITTGRKGLACSRRLFPGHESVLVGARLRQALEHVRGDVIICGLPALILRFIDPELPQSAGYKTIREMSASPTWESIVDSRLRTFKNKTPGVRIVLVDDNCRVIGDSG